jgi:putative transposase
MRHYIRNYVPGGTFFFTVVTYQRRRMLTDALARSTLRSALRQVRARWPFDIIAIVLVPDHLHTVWSMPEGEADYSLRMQKVKETFTKQFLASGGTAAIPSASEAFHGQRGIWQPRFWEHTVRDEGDLKRCVDYVHWNPVKHGLIRRVMDYPWSSFHRYVRLGEYAGDWGAEDPCPGLEMPE